MKLTESKFYEAIYNARKDKSKAAQAAKLVLVDGYKVITAANKLGIDQGGVSRLVNQIRKAAV